jgi:hypothetical protein
MKHKNRLILEFTEFNAQRFNSDSAQIAMHVDNPQLSTNAFDKHSDAIRQAMSRINDILFNIAGNSSYGSLRNKLALEKQNIDSIKILKIIKNTIKYDVYISFIIDGYEYWGVIYDIMDNPTLKSEVFKDHDLIQSKEWIIKITGLIIKTIKTWLKPEPGIYTLEKDEIICYSVETGKQLIMSRGIEIELIRSHNDKIIIKHESDYYNLIGDNYIYFNWWFIQH